MSSHVTEHRGRHSWAEDSVRRRPTRPRGG